MRKFLLGIDCLTILPVLALTLMGVIILLNLHLNGLSIVSQSLILRHIISIVIGLVIAIIISQIDYRGLSTLIQPLFFGMSSLLILVLIFSERINGAKSWFSIGAFNLQPGECA
ncbi:MAG: FtsW/RodA/SpoVE family cell cycle protein, partial [Minisyncoccia bacterium]